MATTTQDYRLVLVNENPDDFQRQIGQALAEGWSLHGPTQMVATTNNLARQVTLAQALVRAKKPAKKAPAKTKADAKKPDLKAGGEPAKDAAKK